MSAYLLAWNPKKWEWYDLEDRIKQLTIDGETYIRWSCGTNKRIQPNDRVFLVRLGNIPEKGIVGASYAKTSPFPDQHYSGANRNALYIEVAFETLLNPKTDDVLSLDILQQGKLSRQLWTPRNSGISIRDELVEELEAVWFDHLRTGKFQSEPLAEPVKGSQTFIEGASYDVKQTRYERNPYARKACLKHYGTSCTVCDFNFTETYGELGNDFIHVHHINQLSLMGGVYEIDPIKDLRPVCPNCHAMIHRKREALSIDDLKQRIRF